MATVIGIDASLTGAGVAVVKDGEFIASYRIVPKNKGVERLIEVETRIVDILRRHEPDLICLEDYAHSKSGKAHQMGELGGVLRVLFHKSELPWIVIGIGQLKKFVTGKGNGKKDLVLMNVFKKWGLQFGNSDEADAFGLAKIGSYLAGDILEGDRLLVTQQEVLDALTVKYSEIIFKEFVN